MPALTSYSPYETLVLFQNIARHGTDAPAFQEISVTLKENQLVREGKSYDSNKFSPAALQSLYEKLIRAQSDEDPKHVNGDTATSVSNPRKRKLSAPPSPKDEEQHEEYSFLQSFVDKLYARFRDEAIKEIRRDEQEFEKLQKEIKELEERVNSDGQAIVDVQTTSVAEPTNGDATGTEVQANADSRQQEQKASQQAVARPSPLPSQTLASQTHGRGQSSPAHTPGASIPRSSTATPQGRFAQPNQVHGHVAHQSSPGHDGSQLQPPSQPPSYGPLQSQQGYPPGMPGAHPQMLPPADHSTGRRTPNQGRLSPAHAPNQPPYLQYSQYHPGPHWQSPVPSQPHIHPQYGAAPFYPQPGRHHQGYQTPNQPAFQQLPHTAPVPYGNQPQWSGSAPTQYPGYPVSASVTPVARSGSRPTILRSSSSTPWKRNTPTPGRRLPSPSRIEREVSPLSDDGSPHPEPGRLRAGKRKHDEGQHHNRLGRPASVTPSAQAASRSQSIMSHASETASEKPTIGRRGPKIKAEPPSTPAAVASDTEPQRSTGRRGRPRNNTTTSRPDVAKPTTAQKRKRESVASRSPSPTTRSPAAHQIASSRRIPSPLDPSLVVVSKNFSKTSQLLLNEITSHKLAGIFAKPLSERDAPGYKDLVLQPQDLKSIKAAVSKGSRAAAVVIEEVEANEDAGEEGNATPTPKLPVVAHGEGSIGNGFFFVRKTEEMVPPKGIVNSSQLEMELVRMFANAVMFNPLPSSERGFGRALRLRKLGGDVLTDQDTDAGESTSSEDEGTPSGDEGGIISDAREMFDDVERLVARWRDLEGERLTGPNIATPGGEPSTTATRHASVSASSAVHEDDDEGAGVATPSAAPPTVGRKRRRIGDH